jgi:hypothetical protein
MISIAEQNKFIEREIRLWIREDVDPTLRAAIAKRERHIPEGTADDLRHDLFQAAGATFTGYRLSFADASRMVDIRPRSIKWTKRPITTQENFMLKWARGRGRKYMKKVPGYKDGKAKNLSEDEKMERFASAIIAATPKPSYKRRRRGAWYNRTIYKLIIRLIERLSKNQADFFAKELGDDIKKKAFGGNMNL